MTPPVIVILGARSLPLARRVQAALSEAVIIAPAGAGGNLASADVAGAIRERFLAGHPIVGLCAAAILIRGLAPCLADKRAEPPVVAIDEAGRHVVPLLGGHRGANALARRLAEALGAVAAITTASDARLGIALDDPPPGWRPADPAAVKPFTAALLEGAALRLDDPDGLAGWLRRSYLPLADDAPLAIEVTHRAINLTPPAIGARLVYHPPVLALGVGCDRGCPADDLIGLAGAALAGAGLAPAAVALVVSLDLKAAEPAVHALAAHLDVPARFLARADLAAQEPRLRNPSEAVRREVGVAGVAEGAALAAVGEAGELIVPKLKGARATVAVGLAPAPLDPAAIGRKRGKLAVVGLGPGGPAWRTAEAGALIRTADEAVGYGLYLDLAADLLRGKPTHTFPLGEERERCRFALERAAGGRDVALLCSGDPGIYAMAALVEELLAGADDPAVRRVEVQIAPGVSAFQLAAARVGAPIGHDFCCVSLSDLLTPMAVIEGRLEAAAAGDFVVALYNPVSATRRSAILRARDILLAHRPADTPTVLARNLGRDGERVEVIDLGNLDADKVDMLTLVLIGGRNSRRFTAPDGRVHVVTPRGYKV